MSNQSNTNYIESILKTINGYPAEPAVHTFNIPSTIYPVTLGSIVGHH